MSIKEDVDYSAALQDTTKLRAIGWENSSLKKSLSLPRKTSLEHIKPGLMQTLKAMRVERLPEYFERSCDQRPGGVAVVCGQTWLTYEQLDRRANRLAHLLLRSGLQQGNSVGILLERSLDTYVALLGVLKAGGSFVPLDASFPADRVEFIAADAGLRCVLTTSAFREKTNQLPCTVLELDEAVSLLEEQPEIRTGIQVDPSSLCYVIYTSGTTGRPKGVAVSHANITNFLRVVTPIYDVMREDRVYQGMSIAFDFSIEEIWPTWIAGAILVAGPTDSRRLGHGLTEFLIKHQVTVLCCVPTLLATIDEDIPSLRSLLVGGEACPADLVRRWYRPERRMLNTYGPTETTVTATWCELFPDRPVTIGLPLPTYRAYILDEHLRPVPDGESGELCIGGPGVAIGYVNRPDLTESRFVPNPVQSNWDAAPRLYRTGDLGRFTSTGEIEYLGRIDTQVKIRGYRIELGEIEQVMREDPAVENAVVKPLEIEGVVQDLVGYVTLSTRRGADSDLRERLHASLQDRLPPYMVPSFIEVLDAFPLLAADKVNRAALPAPVLPRLGGSSSGPYIPPSTPLERQMAMIWEQILGRERISAEDDFFYNLGGHSLAAAQIVSRLRQEPEMHDLAIGDLYQHPTIRRLAQFVNTASDRLAPIELQETEYMLPFPKQHSNMRVLMSGLLQLISLYVFLLIVSVPLVNLYRTTSIGTFALLSLEGVVWLSVSSFLLPVIGGRLLMAGVRPGVHPLWGITYVRIWLYRKLLALSPVAFLAGSPLLPPYLSLLGAKIGRNCHIASAKIGLPMFLDIEDGVSIGYGVHLQPFEVRDGWVRLDRIRLERNSFLGTNSVVLIGAKVGDSASVAEQSLVPQDYEVPANEHWGGSPMKRLEEVPPVLFAMASRAEDRPWTFSLVLGFLFGALLLTLISGLAFVPSIVLVAEVTYRAGLIWGIASTVLAGPLFPLVICILVLLGKRTVMFSAQPGIYPLRSWFGLRKWMSDQLMALSLGLTNTLYATLYLVPFLRLLGARIGAWSEVSTVAYLDPDMMHLGDGSFVADIAVVGPAVFYRNCVALIPASVGERSFVGNGALIPGGSHLGNNSLIGVYSVPPAQEVASDTSWLGSPAIFLPKRQESEQFSDKLTYHPTPGMVAWRLFIEYFRITLPTSILLCLSLLDEQIMYHLFKTTSLLMLLVLTPSLLIGLGIAVTLLVVLLKWIIIGRYRPRVKPLWSVFVRRSELITGLYEAGAVPSLLSFLTGTPWLAPFLRLLGAHIGKRVWLDTTFLTEFDLVSIGDDAAVGETTSLQTHLFEDRVMKMSTVKIGARCSIGSHSVILYDAEIGAGASLDSLSLAMKGEKLPELSYWRGIPARKSKM